MKWHFCFFLLLKVHITNATEENSDYWGSSVAPTLVCAKEMPALLHHQCFCTISSHVNTVKKGNICYYLKVILTLSIPWHCRFLDCVFVHLATIIEYHRLGDLQTTEIYLSHFWSLRSPRSRCRQSWLLVRTHFLVCSGPSFHCVLMWWNGWGVSKISFKRIFIAPVHESCTLLT